MTEQELFLKLREQGRDRSQLQKFCSKYIQQILQYLPVRILWSDGDLNKLFPGLSDQEHKIKVVDIVLEVLRKEPAKLSHCGNIISRVCLELPRLPPHAVVKWCNDSVASITQDSDVNMIWRDVLPECLNAIRSLDTVRSNGSNMTAAEYMKEILQKLFQCQWKERQLVQLTAMFKDLQLSRREHRMFVIKICSAMKDMTPDSLPPLVHQLLKLCKSYNVEIVLAHLSHYFNLRLYRKMAALSQDSESTTMDFEDIEQFSVSELHICLSTCIYHVTEAAGPELCRQLRAWPRSQLARERFVVSVALALLDRGADFRAVCLDVLKSAIEQSVMDEIRRKESAWMRRVLPSDLDLDEMLKELATGGGQHRSLTWMGLIHVSFALLGGARGAEARACAALGARTLAHLAKAHPYTAPQILSLLADRLAAESSNLQYIECLRLLCKTAPISVEPCSELRNILENCQPVAGADGVFDAVHHLINYSERLRDTLVMACRKGLYSRDSAHRCLAASGILTVLRHLRASGAPVASTQEEDGAGGSQCSQSYMSVLTVDVHASQLGGSVSSRISKDTICYEMLSILRRCLGQDAAVKQLLYSRWYSCVKSKPGLHATLLETLYEHLSQYLPEDGEATVLLDKCVQVTATNAVLVEPIGYLLYLIAQLLKSTPHDDVENILASQRTEENLPRTKLKNIMADLSKCNLLAQIDMENLNLTDGTVESKANCIKVQQLLQVYEALVAHHMMQWTVSDGRADVVYHLCKEYTQLLDNTKSPTKASKKASKLDDTVESLKSRRSQASTKSQKASDRKEKKEKKKTPKTQKDKGAFKVLPCLLDLKICHRILQLLYSSPRTEEVPWSSSEQRTSLRQRALVHGWAARAAIAALRRDRDAAHVHAHAPVILELLYKDCLCRFEELFETATDCLEMFNECLNLLCTPKYNCEPASYLSKISDNTVPAVNKANILRTLRTILFSTEHALTQGESAVNKKLFKTITEVLITVLKIPTDQHIELSKEIIKLERHVRETGQECVPLVAQLLAVAAAETCETALLDDLLGRMTLALAPDPETQSTQEPQQFKWVSAGVAGTLRAHVVAHVQTRLACVKHTTARARDLAATLPLAVEANRAAIEKELKEARASCMLQLCQAARAVRSLCALRGGAGGSGGAGGGGRGAARLATQLLRLAFGLLRTLDTAAAREAGLENLLKLLGNRFMSVLRELREQLDGELVPRLVGAAETFRTQVFRLDAKGQDEFQKYVSERIAIGMEIRTDGGASPTDAGDGDTTRDLEDETMDVDSDADTEIIAELDTTDDNIG